MYSHTGPDAKTVTQKQKQRHTDRHAHTRMHIHMASYGNTSDNSALMGINTAAVQRVKSRPTRADLESRPEGV